jgi:hypothetical protein
MSCISVAGQIAVTEQEPEFLQPLENHTVTQGRDIFFTCVVNHLGPYKVRVSGVEIQTTKLTCVMSPATYEVRRSIQGYGPMLHRVVTTRKCRTY